MSKMQNNYPRPVDCICDGDYNHPLIDTKNQYSFWGWLGVLTGISVRPQKVRYWCSRCDLIIGESEDKEARDRYI